MSKHRRAESGRLRKKTQEHQLMDRLEWEFEFPPRMSHGVMNVVTETFFDNREIGADQVDYTRLSIKEGPGNSMEELRKVLVKLTRELMGNEN